MGTTENGYPQFNLIQVSVPVLKDSTCYFSYNFKFDPITQICAGDLFKRKDTCTGDGGGPIIQQINGKWTLMGITSYGSSNCSGITAYTRISAYYDWIFNKNGMTTIKPTTTTNSIQFICGKPEVDPSLQTRIINGIKAAPNSWPVSLT